MPAVSRISLKCSNVICKKNRHLKQPLLKMGRLFFVLKTPLETAAKRRREPEGGSPSVGFGAKPQAGNGAAALTFPMIKKAVSEQNAKHSAIETGHIALQTIEQP